MVLFIASYVLVACLDKASCCVPSANVKLICWSPSAEVKQPINYLCCPL